MGSGIKMWYIKWTINSWYKVILFLNYYNHFLLILIYEFYDKYNGYIKKV